VHSMSSNETANVSRGTDLIARSMRNVLHRLRPYRWDSRIYVRIRDASQSGHLGANMFSLVSKTGADSVRYQDHRQAFVEISWIDDSTLYSHLAKIESISACGASLRTNMAIPHGTDVLLHYEDGELAGFVRLCKMHGGGGYLIRIEFVGCECSDELKSLLSQRYHFPALRVKSWN
jgi:hypothetical protein